MINKLQKTKQNKSENKLTLKKQNNMKNKITNIHKKANKIPSKPSYTIFTKQIFLNITFRGDEATNWGGGEEGGEEGISSSKALPCMQKAGSVMVCVS